MAHGYIKVGLVKEHFLFGSIGEREKGWSDHHSWNLTFHWHAGH